MSHWFTCLVQRRCLALKTRLGRTFQHPAYVGEGHPLAEGAIVISISANVYMSHSSGGIQSKVLVLGPFGVSPLLLPCFLGETRKLDHGSCGFVLQCQLYAHMHTLSMLWNCTCYRMHITRSFWPKRSPNQVTFPIWGPLELWAIMHFMKHRTAEISKPQGESGWRNFNYMGKGRTNAKLVGLCHPFSPNSTPP